MIDILDSVTRVTGSEAAQYINYAGVVGGTLYMNVSHEGLFSECNRQCGALLHDLNGLLPGANIQRAVFIHSKKQTYDNRR